MSKKSSKSRGHQPSRRASAPFRDHCYFPQTYPSERQLAREVAADLPQGDRDPHSYADMEESLTGVSGRMPIPIDHHEDTAHDDAQPQAFSYPPATYREHQKWEQYRQQCEQWPQQSAAYYSVSPAGRPRTTQDAYLPGACLPDASIDDDADFDYPPSLSPRMSPASTPAQPVSMSPNLFSVEYMGAWDSAAAETQNYQYPPGTVELPDRDYAKPNLGKLPDRSLRSESTEALRPSSPFRDIGGSGRKPPASDRNPYREGRSRRHKH